MFKDSGFFPPVSKINYTGNKYLTIQSQVVQNMKLHSEYCLSLIKYMYLSHLAERIFLKEQFVSSSLTVS